MTDLVFYLVVFLAVGVFFLFIHLLIGKFIRPYRPDAEKMTIYECGEPTVGSAWIQFDLRYYVVALLFVIFDVEVAFFFPWAVVFGKANELSSLPGSSAQHAAVVQKIADVERKLNASDTEDADKKQLNSEKEQLEAEKVRIKKQMDDSAPRRRALTQELAPSELNLAYLEAEPPPPAKKKGPPGAGKKGAGKKGEGKKGEGQAKPPAPPDLKKKEMPALVQDAEEGAPPTSRQPPKDVKPIDPETARTWAWIAFGDILVFFGVLMVGFAYLWRRGDIDWVRSTAAEQTEPPITV